MINKGILKFLEKKEAMVIDENPFPLLASVNIVAIDLWPMLNAKKVGRFLYRFFYATSHARQSGIQKKKKKKQYRKTPSMDCLESSKSNN